MKIDYEYEISEERIVAYMAIPELERLRWLEELCVFTNMARQAPDVPRVQAAVIAEPQVDCDSRKES